MSDSVYYVAAMQMRHFAQLDAQAAMHAHDPGPSDVDQKKRSRLSSKCRRLASKLNKKTVNVVKPYRRATPSVFKDEDVNGRAVREAMFETASVQHAPMFEAMSAKRKLKTMCREWIGCAKKKFGVRRTRDSQWMDTAEDYFEDPMDEDEVQPTSETDYIVNGVYDDEVYMDAEQLELSVDDDMVLYPEPVSAYYSGAVLDFYATTENTDLKPPLLPQSIPHAAPAPEELWRGVVDTDSDSENEDYMDNSSVSGTEEESFNAPAMSPSSSTGFSATSSPSLASDGWLSAPPSPQHIVEEPPFSPDPEDEEEVTEEEPEAAAHYILDEDSEDEDIVETQPVEDYSDAGSVLTASTATAVSSALDSDENTLVGDEDSSLNDVFDSALAGIKVKAAQSLRVAVVLQQALQALYSDKSLEGSDGASSSSSSKGSVLGHFLSLFSRSASSS